MNIKRCLMIALAIAMPCAVMAQETPEAQQPAQEPEARQPAQQPEADTKKQTEVKGYVLPILAGIKSAQMSAATLHELATSEPFARRDARKTAELAEQTVKIAREHAEALHKLTGLSPDARAQAEAAVTALRQARSSVDRIQRQVGGQGAAFGRNEAENVRGESARLHTELSQAQSAIEQIARAYHISTSLEPPAGAPAPRKQ